MSVKCEWTEQQIIDDLLENDSNVSLQLHNHLMYCKHCREIYDYWSNIFENENGHLEKPIQPSPALKKRVFRTITEPKKKWLRNKKSFAAACVGVFLLGTVFIAGRLSVSEPHHDIQNSGMQEANTGYIQNQKMAYRVVPIHENNTNGYVWLNPNTKDIMLFLDGLKPIAGRDYQAWLITDNNKENAGILQIDQNFAHVIVHNPHIPSVDRIVISIEPEGGSTIQTGPNAVDLDLRE